MTCVDYPSPRPERRVPGWARDRDRDRAGVRVRVRVRVRIRVRVRVRVRVRTRVRARVRVGAGERGRGRGRVRSRAKTRRRVCLGCLVTAFGTLTAAVDVFLLTARRPARVRVRVRVGVGVRVRVSVSVGLLGSSLLEPHWSAATAATAVSTASVLLFRRVGSRLPGSPDWAQGTA